MSATHITSKELSHILTNSRRSLIRLIEGTCLLWDATLYHALYLPSINGNEIITHAVVWRHNRNRRTTKTTLRWLVAIVQQTRIRIMEGIMFNDDVLSKTHDGGSDTSS